MSYGSLALLLGLLQRHRSLVEFLRLQVVQPIRPRLVHVRLLLLASLLLEPLAVLLLLELVARLRVEVFAVELLQARDAAACVVIAHARRLVLLQAVRVVDVPLAPSLRLLVQVSELVDGGVELALVVRLTPFQQRRDLVVPDGVRI